MENNKPFYKRASFYLAAAALLFVVIAVALYAGNCKSEFNGNKVSSAVVGWDAVAVVMLVIAVAGEICEHYFSADTLLGKICGFLRLTKYVAFVALLVAFFMQILDEYSLLGTVLYPIVSGTVGDPVDGALSASYFTSLIFTLVAVAVSIVSALLHKMTAYGKTKKAKNAGNTDEKEQEGAL